MNIWNFDLYLLYMEENNLLDYNHLQQMKRAPTLITRPILVFLAPTKNGLRIPILKCNIRLARNHMAPLHNQPLLCTSISAHHSTGQHCSSISGQSTHHYCLTLMLITTTQVSLHINFAHHCWSLSSAH